MERHRANLKHYAAERRQAGYLRLDAGQHRQEHPDTAR